MNSSNVIEVGVNKKFQLIIGMIPSHNQFILDAIAPVIMPGIEELVVQSMGEFTAFQTMFDILYGGKQLRLFYMNFGEEVKEEEFQMHFANRLQTPAKDYAGFAIVQPLRESGYHVFAGYVVPEYRRENVAMMVAGFLEREAIKMGAPYISTTTSPMYAAGVEKAGYTRTTVNLRKKLKG